MDPFFMGGIREPIDFRRPRARGALYGLACIGANHRSELLKRSAPRSSST